MEKSSGKVFMLILCGVNSETPRSKLFVFQTCIQPEAGKTLQNYCGWLLSCVRVVGVKKGNFLNNQTMD